MLKISRNVFFSELKNERQNNVQEGHVLSIQKIPRYINLPPDGGGGGSKGGETIRDLTQNCLDSSSYMGCSPSWDRGPGGGAARLG